MDRKTPLLCIADLQLIRSGERLLHVGSFALGAGERVALVGPSGAGKTLLLRSLALLEEWQAGTLDWCGGPVADADVPRYRSEVIYLHQKPSLGEGTVEQNLREVFQLKVHRHHHFDRAFAAAFLDEVGLGQAFLGKQVRDLSGGEAQLTALLRAVQTGPRVLLLDEPTSALDAARNQALEAWLMRWAEGDGERAYLWVTHNAEQVKRVSNRIVTMEKGGRLL